MMKRLFIFVLVACTTVLNSCGRQVKNDRLKRIDSLGIQLNYVRESLEEIDSVMMYNRITTIDQTSEWVYDNITDTLPREGGMEFGDLIRTKKYLNQAIDRYNEVSKELAYSENQLQSLRKDVENSFYSEEEFKGYFSTEAESIEKLVEATDELKSRYTRSNGRYEKFYPQVKKLVDSLKSVVYASDPIAR